MPIKDEPGHDGPSPSDMVTRQPFLEPVFATCSTQQKIELLYALFNELPVSQRGSVLRRLKEFHDDACHCNPLELLPRELIIDMLCHLDVPSVHELMMVSRDWYVLCQDAQVWKALFLQQGWQVDRSAKEASQQAHHPFSTLQSRPIDRTLAPLVISSSQSITRPLPIRRQKKKRVPTASASTSLLPLGKKRAAAATSAAAPTDNHENDQNDENDSDDPASSSSSASHTPYHPQTDRIDWKYLYQQRFRLANAWRHGKYRPYRFRSDPDNQTSDHPSHAQRQRDQHTDSVYSIVLDPPHHLVYSASRDKTVKEWRFSNGIAALQHTYTELHHGSILCIEIANDYLATASSDCTASLIHRWERRLIAKFKGHENSVLNVALDDTRLYTCSKDKTIKIWSLDTYQCLQTLHGHRESVNVIKLAGDHLLSGSGDHTLKLWDKNTGVCLQTFVGHERSVASIDMSDEYIVSGSSDQSIIVWDKQGHIVHKLFGHPELVRTLQMRHHNGRLIMISADYNDKFNLWDVQTGQLLLSFPRYYPGRVMNLRFDNMKIVLGIDTGDIVVYDFAADIDTRLLI
ncbi:WD40-repeat-containing domain protein [Gongronella butleri]|nr:WD40-repeat-containing domain protein [Gongronella butleri]